MARLHLAVASVLGRLGRASLHRWRLMVEQPGRGVCWSHQARRWRVHYAEGGMSRAMAYDVACDYARMFGGRVVRATQK